MSDTTPENVVVLDQPIVRGATTIDQISLVLKDGRTVIWGSADESDTKAEVLATLLATVQAGTYDVSVPSKPTTKP